MSENKPADHLDRDAAATRIDKNIVVVAGAGTGKTTLLINRLMRLLLVKEIPVERIVALTFTKKAAEEMRERLEERLRDDNSALAKQALNDIPKAQIGTIHSFAGSLLRLYPLQAGVDPAFREDDGTLRERVLEAEWQSWIAEELRGGAGTDAAWLSLLENNTLEDLRLLAFDLADPVIDWAEARKPVELASFYDELRSMCRALLDANGVPPRAPVFTRAWATLNEWLLDPKKKLDVDALDRLDSPPTSWPDAKPKLKYLKAAARALASVNEAAIAAALSLLEPFVRRARAELRRQGVVSFDELLLRARNLLRDHTSVRIALKRRFDTFLIDEFQDTDPLQSEIVVYLAESLDAQSSTWENAELGEGRLFVVGDPKQSIYRFRGADIAAFESVMKRVTDQNGLQSLLSSNYRSVAPILEFVNRVFEKIMRVDPLIQPPYAPLIAARVVTMTSTPQIAGPEVELIRFIPEDEQEWSAEEGRLVEAQAIGDWIHENVPSRCQYKDIALLFRSAHAFEPYLEAFRAREIPYLAEGEKSFYRTPELVTFFNLLSVVSDPTDKLALVGILRSPLGALNDGEIWELKKANGLDPLAAPPLFAERIGSLYRALAELSTEARAQPLLVTLRRILSALWVRELSGGEQAKANIEKMLRLAQTWSEPVPLTLPEFVAHFAKFRDDERDEGENPLADAMFDAVKVMTIHKAKGLEFPVVFLPNLSGGRRAFADRPRVERSWRSGSVGIRLRGSEVTNAAAAMLDVQSKRHEEAEEIRIFYVAATRAKNRLICTMSKSGGQPGPFAKLLSEAGADVREQPASLNDATFHSQRKTAVASQANLAHLIVAFQRRSVEFEEMKGFKFFSSPSQLQHEPEKKMVEDDEENPSRDEAIAVGHICHKVLEWEFSGQWPRGLKKGKEAIAEAGRLFDVSADHESGKRVLNDAKKILANFYASDIFSDLKKQKILGCEVPFHYSLKPGAAMHGIMDLVYEENGQVIVADYKTSRVNVDTKSAIVERYAAQGAAYQEAILKALGQKALFEIIFLRTNERVRLS